MSDYFYFDIEIKLEKALPSLSQEKIEEAIQDSLTTLFGQSGGAIELDVLKCDLKRCRLILRVPKAFYVQLRAALTCLSVIQTWKLTWSVESMSLCKSYGKDKVIFATKEDHATPSTIQLPESEPRQGLILESGEINWNCPCLGGMAIGPCGNEFREAFSCFHYSQAQPKGSDCYEAFSTMNECMRNYPGVYKQNLNEDEEEDAGAAGVASMIADEGEEEDDVEELPTKMVEEQKAVATKAK